MNKKTIVMAVVALALVGGIGYLAFGGDKNESTFPGVNDGSKNVKVEAPADAPKLEVADNALVTKLEGVKLDLAEFEVVGGTELVKGQATFPVGDTGTKGTVSLGKVAIEKAIGGKSFAVATLDISISGKAYTYVALFETVGGSFIQKSIEFLGEGVEVRNIAAADTSASDFAVVASTVVGGSTRQIILSVEGGVINSAKTIAL